MKLKNSRGIQLGDAFGISVAIGDGIAVVGASYTNGKGAAYIFRQNPDGENEWAFEKASRRLTALKGMPSAKTLSATTKTWL
jgi:hypothetical protein